MLRNILLFAFCLAATAAFFTYQGKASYLDARESRCLSQLALKGVEATSAKAACGCLTTQLDERMPLIMFFPVQPLVEWAFPSADTVLAGVAESCGLS